MDSPGADIVRQPAPTERQRSRLAPYALLVGAKLAASLVVWLDGFRAVSDDDYARVTIAQTWAHAPALDPTGTSWLPLPFWVYGSALGLFGSSLVVAQATAWVLGALSVLLIYEAARKILGDEGKALVAALLSAVVPWCARLGVATVPELPVAALTLFAIAALVRERDASAPAAPNIGTSPLLGGAALFAATLSRYDPWPIAAGFALLCVLDAMGSSGKQRARALGGALLALAGPILWVLHNARAHGDPFAFAARVADYKRALGQGDELSIVERLVVYPRTLVMHEPELFGALVIVAAALALTQGKAALRAIPWHRFRRPAALAALGVAALSLAGVRDGAPTHHPERAVLVVLLLAIVLAGELVVRFAASRPSRRASLAALGAIVVIGIAAIPFRIVFRVPGDFVVRSDEIEIGHLVAARVPAGDTVLCEVTDFGYFAILAGSGRPERFVLDRTLDPREGDVPSSFADPAALERRIEQTGARWVVARRSGVLDEFGFASTEDPGRLGGWALFGIAP